MNTGIEGSMEFFRMARNICFGLAIAFAILAVLTFILFDIRTIFLIKTGRAQRRTITEMNERNQHTGKLRQNTENGHGKTKENTVGKTVKEKAIKTRKGSTQPIKDTLSSSDETLVPQSMGEPAGTNSNEANSSARETALLSRAENERRANPSLGFRVVKRIIVTHTDENIAV